VPKLTSLIGTKS